MQEFKFKEFNLRFDIRGLRDIAEAVGDPDNLEPLSKVESAYKKVAYILWSGRLRFAKHHKQPIPDITPDSCLDDIDNWGAGDMVAIIQHFHEAHSLSGNNNGEPAPEEKKSIVSAI